MLFIGVIHPDGIGLYKIANRDLTNFCRWAGNEYKDKAVLDVSSRQFFRTKEYTHITFTKQEV